MGFSKEWIFAKFYFFCGGVRHLFFLPRFLASKARQGILGALWFCCGFLKPLHKRRLLPAPCQDFPGHMGTFYSWVMHHNMPLIFTLDRQVSGWLLQSALELFADVPSVCHPQQRLSLLLFKNLLRMYFEGHLQTDGFIFLIHLHWCQLNVLCHCCLNLQVKRECRTFLFA